MGRIHVARDRRLGREVALKEVLVQAGVAARRFEREARITARLQHPSIVSVYEAGMWPSGEPFYAMRLVSGRSLDEAIGAAGTFDDRLALLPSVLAVADAMAYAHDQRVIHRDLKPRNVVVGKFGETVVIDWGLAKELDRISTPSLDADPAGTDLAGETRAGDIVGTPAYMPPEQAAGELVDERADVYAIGALLYHVLAGRAPYVEPTSAEVIAALHAGPPLPIAQEVPQAPRELVAIVERAMARDVASRYRTARELAEDLRRFQTGQLVGAHRYSLRQLLLRWLRRHRTVLAAAAAAAIAAIAIGVFALARIVEANRRVEQQRELAVGDRKNAERLIGFMLGDLHRKLDGVGRLDLMDGVARQVAGYYDARAQLDSDEETFQSAQARGDIANVYAVRGDHTAAEQQLMTQRALLQALVARRPDVVKYRSANLEAGFRLIEIQIERGDLSGAFTAANAMLGEAEAVRAAHPDDPLVLRQVCRGQSELASILDRRGDIAGALAEYRREIDLAAASRDGGEETEHVLAMAHGNAARMLAMLRADYHSALAEYQLSLDIATRWLARDPKSRRWLADATHCRIDIASVLGDHGDLTAAQTELESSVATATQLVAVDPSSAENRYQLSRAEEHLGNIMFKRKNYPGAMEHYQAAYDLTAAMASAEPTNLYKQRQMSVLLNKVGDVQLEIKHPADALASYRRVGAIREKLVATDPTNAEWHRDLFYSHHKIASALRAQHENAAAVTELRSALALAVEAAARVNANQTASDDLVKTHVELAKAFDALHDLAGVRTELEAALTLVKAEAAAPGAPGSVKAQITEYQRALAKLPRQR